MPIGEPCGGLDRAARIGRLIFLQREIAGIERADEKDPTLRIEHRIYRRAEYPVFLGLPLIVGPAGRINESVGNKLPAVLKHENQAAFETLEFALLPKIFAAGHFLIRSIPL